MDGPLIRILCMLGALCYAVPLYSIAFLVACPSDLRQKLPITHHRPCFTFTSLAKGSRPVDHAQTTVRDVTKTLWKHCVQMFYERHIEGHDRLVVHTMSTVPHIFSKSGVRIGFCVEEPACKLHDAACTGAVHQIPDQQSVLKPSRPTQLQQVLLCAHTWAM